MPRMAHLVIMCSRTHAGAVVAYIVYDNNQPYAYQLVRTVHRTGNGLHIAVRTRVRRPPPAHTPQRQLSQISSPLPHSPRRSVHRQRPSPDRTKLRMTNTCEQTKHSIHGIQILFMWCQQTPLLDKHKLRSQALVDEFRQPPNIHNIGTYPPQNGHPGCDTTHRLTHKRPHLCQSSRSRTRQPTYQKKISSRSPLSG